MKYALYYWLFEPLRGGFRDNPTRKPAFSVSVTHQDRMHDVSLLLHDDGSLEALRLTIPGLKQEQIQEDLLPLLQLVKEHMLSCLRLGYREDIQLFPMTVWAFFEEGAPHSMDMQIETNLVENLNAEKTKNFFVAAFPFRHEVRLLVDGNDARIPVQYRYLSFYKLLEHEFKSKGHWKYNDLDAFLASYELRFRSLGCRGTIHQYLHEWRDRCAHIRTGRSKELFGVNSLNHKETTAVSKILPIFRDMCRDLLNRKTGEAFQLGDIRPWYERVKPESGVPANIPEKREPAAE